MLLCECLNIIFVSLRNFLIQLIVHFHIFMCSVGPAARAQCIVVYVLKEAAAPESEEFEVSAKSAVHRRLASLFPYLY